MGSSRERTLRRVLFELKPQKKRTAVLHVRRRQDQRRDWLHQNHGLQDSATTRKWSQQTRAMQHIAPPNAPSSRGISTLRRHRSRQVRCRLGCFPPSERQTTELEHVPGIEGVRGTARSSAKRNARAQHVGGTGGVQSPSKNSEIDYDRLTCAARCARCTEGTRACALGCVHERRCTCGAARHPLTPFQVLGLRCAA